MLTVITGPMFAGKSSALISRAMSHVIAGDMVMSFKPKLDDRYGGKDITTHYGDRIAAYAVETTDDVFRLTDKYKPNVVLFDEAQFFDKEVLKTLAKVFSISCHVVVAGLSQDSYGEPFGAMPELLSFADNIICLKAVCSKCKKINSATRTYRKTKDKSQVVVGGIDAYEPRCFGCWITNEEI